LFHFFVASLGAEADWPGSLGRRTQGGSHPAFTVPHWHAR
jgi:hypothetical protein